MKTAIPSSLNFTALILTAALAGCSLPNGQSAAEGDVTPLPPSSQTAARDEPALPSSRPQSAVESDAVATAKNRPIIGEKDDARRSVVKKERRRVPAMEINSMEMKTAPAQALTRPMLMEDLADRNGHSSRGGERERFARIIANRIKQVSAEPVSTFSIDVDSGAYSLVRRNLNRGHMPATDMVRIEEMINYFNYAYPQPDGDGGNDVPFSITTEVSRTPWNSESHLLHIGIQGVDIESANRPAANLVFLIDVSGSMGAPNKLPLLKSAFRLLVKQLNGQDRVTMVVYAGASGVVLESTSDKGKIIAALEGLNAGGATHGSSGIHLAYAMAEQAMIPGGINRVILATDGDFNVGTVNHQQLMNLIEQKRRAGISLTTLGFGSGNYNDHLMEQLADKGNGIYAYIDNMNEAQKVLVDELSSTLATIAKDVKIQIEWNPTVVSEYRLIGYNNRLLNREDFNNDKIDAGEIGAGHSVTALYEVTLVDGDRPRIDPLRYGTAKEVTSAGRGNELAFLRLRYKAPDATKSKLIEQVIATDTVVNDIGKTGENYRFSAAVAGFGLLLRGAQYSGNFDYAAVKKLAQGARGRDEYGYRGEFIRLVNLAAGLSR